MFPTANLPFSLARRRWLAGTLAMAGAGAATVWRQSYLDQASEDDWQSVLRRRVSKLADIPQFDAREVGVVGHAQVRVPQIKALLEYCIGRLTPAYAFGAWGLDRAAAAWLRGTRSRYTGELDEIASLVGTTGVYLVNASYEWGCTALAGPSADHKSARLLRTLDWPFNGLGLFVEVLRQRGPAGEFYNVTWPGAVGALTAMAPGRFAASINQAPIRRRFKGEVLLSLDEMLDTAETFFQIDDPPAMHLLREVFEFAPDFRQAKTMLESRPIASPAIFTLVGLDAQETCVIERVRNGRRTHMGVASAANDWRYGSFAGQWEAQGASDEEPKGDNAQRSKFIENFAGRGVGDFDWLRDPILNGNTRVAVEADPRQRRLRVRGYEATEDEESAAPVTAILDIHAT